MDLHLVLEAGLSVIGFLSAIWMRSVREEIRGLHGDVKELVKTVSDHGERIAVLEAQVGDLRGR